MRCRAVELRPRIGSTGDLAFVDGQTINRPQLSGAARHSLCGHPGRARHPVAASRLTREHRITLNRHNPPP
jgi:hypothetical protein